MADNALINRFRQARRDASLAVMDGLHAVKHGLRFGAEVVELVSPDVEAALRLAGEVAPDVAGRLAVELMAVAAEDFRCLSPVPPDTGVIGIARRPAVRIEGLTAAAGLGGLTAAGVGGLAAAAGLEGLEAAGVGGLAAAAGIEGLAAAGVGGLAVSGAPVVLLENPRNPFNIGAAVRVAAAAGAAGVLVTGAQDPWHPAAIVAAAGLQFALPVARVDALPEGPRAVIAIAPQGEPMPWGDVPPGAVLAFGAERTGLSRQLLGRAGRCLAIPMTPGVSSLNLATSVAVALYALKG